MVTALGRALTQLCADNKLSSAHVNFCLAEEAAALRELGFLERLGYQYHWRNTGFTTDTDMLADWQVGDREAFYAASLRRITDHGEDRYILAVHLLKTVLAAREEIASGLPPQTQAIVLAALLLAAGARWRGRAPGSRGARC